MATLALLLSLLVVSALVWLVRSLPCCCGRREAAQWFRFGAAGGRLECACDTCVSSSSSSSSSSSLRTKRARLVSKHRLRVAVIGAGPAGASAAYQLGQRGHDVTVYEASDKPGGRTFTLHSEEEGYHFDTGAAFFTNFYPLLLHLLPALRLGRQVRRLQFTKGFVDTVTGAVGRIRVGSLLSFLRFSLLTVRQRVAFLLHAARFALRSHRYDVVDPAVLARDDDSSESALSENVKALGWHSTNVLVRVGVETFWYFGLAQTSRALTRALVAKAGSSQFYALRCGLGAITKQLLTHPNITLHCSCPVATIGCHPSTQQLIIEGQTYDAAVVATTANVATKLCTSTPATAALLTPRQQDFLASQQYASNLHIAYLVPMKEVRRAFPDDVYSFTPSGEGTWTVAAVTLSNGKTPSAFSEEQAGIQVYLVHKASVQAMDSSPGGARGAVNSARVQAALHAVAQHAGSAVVDKEVQEYLGEKVWRLARELLPALPQYSSGSTCGVFARRHALPIPSPGRYISALAFDDDQRAPLVLAGDYLSTGTVEGALRSGLRAAQLVHQSATTRKQQQQQEEEHVHSN